jgi:hypothetical protein
MTAVSGGWAGIFGKRFNINELKLGYRAVDNHATKRSMNGSGCGDRSYGYRREPKVARLARPPGYVNSPHGPSAV